MDQKESKIKAAYCLNCKNKPCRNGCPLGNDIPSFIACIKEEKYEEAYQILCQTTMLPAVCGRICPHDSQCQGSCIRGIKGKPVSIGELEAFVGDIAIEKNMNIPNIAEKNNKKVSIIGGGPAGLTAAGFLARMGYEVTIYEKADTLGGILNHGIPEFRLDTEALNRSIERIINLGIKVQCNKELGKDITIEQLKKNQDAIFVAFGANISSPMGIEGEELDGVYGGNQLLENKEHPEYQGKSVGIIGGGNVAMDAARSIKRLGAKEVYVIYRRARKQMPAEPKEIEDAEKEGIRFLFQNNIVKVIGNKENKVKEIECIKTELVKQEGESREVPVNVEGSNYKLEMDFVVMAVGSGPERKVVEGLGLETSKRGYILVNENYQTSDEKVFAGGDLAGGKATVAWASKAGREAAIGIQKYLEN